MDWTQSTIKTILGRLVGKGVLNTEHEGRKFIYTANIEEKGRKGLCRRYFLTVFAIRMSEM